MRRDPYPVQAGLERLGLADPLVGRVLSGTAPDDDPDDVRVTGIPSSACL